MTMSIVKIILASGTLISGLVAVASVVSEIGVQKSSDISKIQRTEVISLGSAIIFAIATVIVASLS